MESLAVLFASLPSEFWPARSAYSHPRAAATTHTGRYLRQREAARGPSGKISLTAAPRFACEIISISPPIASARSRILARPAPFPLVDASPFGSKLPPQIGIEPEFQPAGGRAEAKLDLARGEDVAGESTHALRQIANSVAPRIDRPDDVAHRIHQVARR